MVNLNNPINNDQLLKQTALALGVAEAHVFKDVNKHMLAVHMFCAMMSQGIFSFKVNRQAYRPGLNQVLQVCSPTSI